jgi:hypothetical protein
VFVSCFDTLSQMGGSSSKSLISLRNAEIRLNGGALEKVTAAYKSVCKVMES